MVDGEGRPVTDEDARAHPARIAAVHHVASGADAYREVIVVDERWVERWAFATEGIRARLAHDAERLRALADRWREHEPTTPDDLAAWLREGWSAEPEDDLVSRYRGCLALGSPHYAPTPAHLDAMADALDATPFDATLEHTVRRHHWFGSVIGTRTFCDETYGCWDTHRRPGFVPVTAR